MEEGWGEKGMVHRSRSLDTDHLTPTRSVSLSLPCLHLPPSLHYFSHYVTIFSLFYVTFHSLVQRCEYIWDWTLESYSREYFSQVENYIESDCPRIIFNVVSNSWEQLRRVSLSNYIRIVMISMKITTKDNYLRMSFVFSYYFFKIFIYSVYSVIEYNGLPKMRN